MSWKTLSLATLLLAGCANDIVEICDDGADNDQDGLLDCEDNNCSALPSCASQEICGIEGDEDGNGLSDCQDPFCGAHPLCNPETNCNDGQDNDADGQFDCADVDCADSPACAPEGCGDNIVGSGEECDGTNLSGFECIDFGFAGGSLACQDSCIFTFTGCTDTGCGDGIIDFSEECDDGNNLGGDGCSSSCRAEFCGDGIISINEECDDGNTNNNDGCSAFCEAEGDLIDEKESNEDGTPEPGGDAFNGNDFDTNDIATTNALNNGAALSGGGNTLIAATLTPAGDEDVFAVTNNENFIVRFSVETFTNLALTECVSIDTVINIRNQPGGVLELDDDNGIETCSLITDIEINPGETLFVQVTDFGDDESIPQYFLQIRF